MAGINPAITKQQLRQINELATTFRWSLSLIRPPTSPSIYIPPGNALDLQCSTVETPKHEDNQLIDVNVKGQHIQRPGVTDCNHNITLTFIETIDNHVRKMIKSWREAYWAYNTGKAELYDTIHADFLLRSLDGRHNAVWDYLIEGAIIVGSDPGGDHGSDSEAFRPTITLYFDDFQQNSTLA